MSFPKHYTVKVNSYAEASEITEFVFNKKNFFQSRLTDMPANLYITAIRNYPVFINYEKDTIPQYTYKTWKNIRNLLNPINSNSVVVEVNQNPSINKISKIVIELLQIEKTFEISDKEEMKNYCDEFVKNNYPQFK